MSMRSIPASGYTVKASEFTKVLPENQQERYAKAITDQDAELVDEILNEHLPQDFPGYEQVYLVAEEDESDELEKGEVYVVFDESDLYVKEPTRQHEIMRFQEISPKFSRWTVWG